MAEALESRIETLEARFREVVAETNAAIREREAAEARAREREIELRNAQSAISELRAALEQMRGEVESLRAEAGGGLEQPLDKPPPVLAEQPVHFVDPDAVGLADDASPRKSIDFTPETDGMMQLNEFDDPTSVGTLALKKRTGSGTGEDGKTFLALVDPDETKGTAKWLIPVRRVSSSGAIELKWMKIGNEVELECSSSSASDPCPPKITAEHGTGEDAGYIILTIQNRKPGTSGCVDDGDPQVVKIPIAQFQLDCNAVRACIDCATVRNAIGIVGMAGPPAISKSGDTITIQPRMYAVGNDSCLKLVADGSPITFTEGGGSGGGGGAGAGENVTVLTGAEVQNNTLFFTTQVLTVLAKGATGSLPIQGTTCSESEGSS